MDTLRASRQVSMNLHLTIRPLVSLVAGILILVMPRLLNYIVAIYLIIIDLLGLFGSGSFHLVCPQQLRTARTAAGLLGRADTAAHFVDRRLGVRLRVRDHRKGSLL